jgi:hypothetical protein
MMCGSCSVEAAYKACFIAYKKKLRRDKPFSDEELKSVMLNQ